MRTLALIILVAVAFAPVARANLSPDALKRAKARIETLLGNRRGTSARPVDPANPFVLPETAPVTSQGPTIAVATEAPLTKSDTLARLAANLNVSGYIQIQGVPHLIINRQTYRENDLIPVRASGGSVTFVLLKKIAEKDFLLEFEGAEFTQKHTEK